jgi:hypothetical protein
LPLGSLRRAKDLVTLTQISRILARVRPTTNYPPVKSGRFSLIYSRITPSFFPGYAVGGIDRTEPFAIRGHHSTCGLGTFFGHHSGGPGIVLACLDQSQRVSCFHKQLTMSNERNDKVTGGLGGRSLGDGPGFIDNEALPSWWARSRRHQELNKAKIGLGHQRILSDLRGCGPR